MYGADANSGSPSKDRNKQSKRTGKPARNGRKKDMRKNSAS